MARAGLGAADRATLGRVRIGLLALNGRQPVVNPVAFHHAGDAIWMTTSRCAAKLALARRDPRAAFALTAGGRSLLARGTLTWFDPLRLEDQLRAALEGPHLYWAMAGYLVKNSAFMGGYILEAARIPAHWWPQNRVALRLQPASWASVPALAPPRPSPAPPGGVPPDLARILATVGGSHICWRTGTGLAVAPALWTWRGGALLAMPASPRWPAGPGVGTLVIDEAQGFRATRMRGACFRGELVRDPSAAGAIRSRYGPEVTDAIDPGPMGLRLDPARVTWWRGFEVRTDRFEPTPSGRTSPEAHPRTTPETCCVMVGGDGAHPHRGGQRPELRAGSRRARG